MVIRILRTGTENEYLTLLSRFSNHMYPFHCKLVHRKADEPCQLWAWRDNVCQNYVLDAAGKRESSRVLTAEVSLTAATVLCSVGLIAAQCKFKSAAETLRIITATFWWCRQTRHTALFSVSRLHFGFWVLLIGSVCTNIHWFELQLSEYSDCN